MTPQKRNEAATREGLRRFLMALLASALEGGVEGVEVLLLQAILHQGQGFGKTLVVHDLPCTQEAKYVLHVGVVGQVDQVFVGGTGLLLWYDLISATF